MDVANEIKKMLYNISGEKNPQPEMRLKEDCGLDSLSLVSFIIDAEEKFGIQFNDSDLDPSSLVTYEDAVKLIEKYIEQSL